MKTGNAATPRERMLAGELYDARDPELVAARLRAAKLLHRYRTLAPDEGPERRRILEGLLGHVGADVEIVPPFHCDYGVHLSLGDRTFVNVNFVALDVVPITLGRDVLVGPDVQLLAATHPLDPTLRRQQLEYGRPIHVADGVWLGGGVIVCPGVSIGADTVVGAGSVVTRDLPAGVVAVGNPARVVRTLDEARERGRGRGRG